MSQFEIYLRNNYVDLEDIENPIKNYTNSIYETYYQWGKDAFVYLKVKKNEVYLEDSLFPLFNKVKPKIFYSISFEKSNEITNTNPYYGDVPLPGFINVRVTIDPEVDQYRRKLLNFLEVLGIVGGVFELLEVLGGFFVGILSYVYTKREISRSLAKFEQEFRKLSKALDNVQPLPFNAQSSLNIPSQEEAEGGSHEEDKRDESRRIYDSREDSSDSSDDESKFQKNENYK